MTQLSWAVPCDYLLSAGLLLISGDSRIACITRRCRGQFKPASRSLTARSSDCCWCWCCLRRTRCCGWWCSLQRAKDACWVVASDVTSPSDIEPPPSPIPIPTPAPAVCSFLAWRGGWRLTLTGQLLQRSTTAGCHVARRSHHLTAAYFQVSTYVSLYLW